jgi:GrpB-like predicted nucleotidyltransferase (UPF0157 family)
LGELALGIEHYGSTAVEGLRAKPILDIVVGVLPLDNWTRCRGPLEALGYDYAEHAGIPDDFVFGRGRNRSERTHLVHVVAFAEELWRQGLAFRTALRGSPELRRQYLAIKERAVEKFPEGRARYTAEKRHFIEGVLRQLRP